MKLSSDERRRIRRAIKDAFPASTEALERVVADADIGVQFAEFQQTLYETRIQTLIDYAVGRYQLNKLLKAAVDEAPDNPELREIAGLVERYYGLLQRVLRNNPVNA